MKVYSALCALPVPRSYLGKILAISFLGTHVPLIGAVVYVLLAADIAIMDQIGILVAVLVATLVGTAATLVTLYALLAPVGKASEALRAYLETGVVPALPTRYTDSAGVLMANVQEAVTRLDLALDTTTRQRDEAVQAKQEKFELLAGLSHDLRTPLNHVIGFAELMSSETLGPLGRKEYVEYAGDIGTSGGDLLNTLSAVLDLSDAEAGKVRIDLETLPLTTSLRRAVNLARHKAERAGIEIEIDAEIGEALAVRSDERYLKQVLLHLLEVAMAAPESTTRVFVTAGEGQDTATVCIESDSAWRREDVPPEFQGEQGVLADFMEVRADVARYSSPAALRLSLVASLARLIESRLKVGTSINGGRQMAVVLPIGAPSNQTPEKARTV